MSDFLSYEDIQQLESQANDLFEKSAFGECERLLRRLILECPLRSDYFGRVGRVHESLGAADAAEIAFRRERQLQIIEANFKPSAVVDQVTALWGAGANAESSLTLGGFRFGPAQIKTRGQSQIRETVSLCGGASLQICDLSGERDAFIRETNLLARLSHRSCETSPRVLAIGEGAGQDSVVAGSAPYRVIAYSRADRGGFGYGDLILALLEQQALGCYVNDLSLENIRYDSVNCLLRFSNYSKALELDEDLQTLSPRAFLTWCHEKERERLTADRRYSFLLGSCQQQEWVWDHDRLKAAASQLFQKQRIESLPEPSVQSVDTPALTFCGTFDWSEKKAALERLGFVSGERVLDVGCGMGLGARWLSLQGCEVTGIDTDMRLLRAARIISTIDGAVGLTYAEHDFDYVAMEGEWDTVLLLSVFNCFVNPADAAERIAACCGDRLIIEAGPAERGFKWFGRWYRPRLAWKFDTEAEFIEMLESRFEGFRLSGQPVDSIFGRKFYTLKRGGTGSV